MRIPSAPRLHRLAATVATVFLTPLAVGGIDAPHATDAGCASCHVVHAAPGADLTTVAGDANLCMSCHVVGGVASAKAFVAADQALPWPGLITGVAPAGNSHRWDASAAGHLVFLGGAAMSSTGTIVPTGVYTGAFAKTYTIQITNSGAVGVAAFNWSATTPGGGSGVNVLTDTNAPLEAGVCLQFGDGTNVSFQAGDSWYLFVRPDLRDPTNAELRSYATNGVATCSACHNDHSESLQPFDPAAQPYLTNATGLISGTNRHFMRVANDVHQLCNDCHAARAVTNAADGSHPVEIKSAADAKHKLPALLPVEVATTNMGCLSCHAMHHGPDGDGKLLRLTNSVALCNDCHTLSDAASAHFSVTNNATLWPGGKYGSLMPARTDLNDRGTCLNCHAVHGWPTNAASPTIHFEHLLADFEERFCYTCHGVNGPAAKLVYADFQKAYRHPVVDTDAFRRAGRSVECSDCHNAHKARAGSHVYTATATAFRNSVTNAPSLRGVDGVAFNYVGLTNFQAVTTNRFTYLAATSGATNEYQICFKCHTSYYWRTGSPPSGISPNGTALNPVETDLAQEFSPMNKSGHPIMTGLDNYPNSTVISGKRGLLAAAMKAPWNVNVGQQTMLCSDCHDATTTNYVAAAAQGPHGSAYRFMLRGPNGNNWPDVANTSAGFASSWCANCHNNSSSVYHGGNHTSYRCYVCHIVIPHGGKMSRLIGDRDTMPARYAFNNTLTTMQMRTFTKTTATGYGTGNCGAACHHSSGSENW